MLGDALLEQPPLGGIGGQRAVGDLGLVVAVAGGQVQPARAERADIAADQIDPAGAGVEVVGVKVDLGEVAAAGDALGDQRRPDLRRDDDGRRDAEALGDVDLIEVHRAGEAEVGPPHQPARQGLGGLRPQRLGAQEGGHGVQRRQPPVGEHLQGHRVEALRGAGREQLARRRGAEAGGVGGAHRDLRRHGVAHGDLAVGGVAELVEVLGAQREVDAPLGGQVGLGVDIAGEALLVPLARLLRVVAGEAVGLGRQAGGRARAHRVGGRVARLDLVGLQPPLGAEGDVDRLGQGRQRQAIDRVGVEVELGLGQAAQVERGRAVRPQRGVDRIVQEEAAAVLAVGGAEVPGEPLRAAPAHAADHLVVRRPDALARGEAGRVDLVEVEAWEHRGDLVDAGVGGGVAPVDVVEAVALDVGAEAVGFDPAAQRLGRVEGEARRRQLGVAPALHRIGDGQRRVGGLESDGVRPLVRARGGVAVRILHGGDQMAVAAQRGPAAHADLIAGAVAEIALGGLGVGRKAGLCVEDDVDDAGDGVGAVLGRGPVAQHLDVADGVVRDLGEVGGLRAVDADEGRAVEALAVHQHQGHVRRQVVQRGWADELQAVRGRQPLDVERRDQLGQALGELVGGPRLDGRLRQHVDRRQGRELGLGGLTRAGDDDLVHRGDRLLLGQRRAGRAEDQARHGRAGEQNYSKHAPPPSFDGPCS